MQGVLVAVFSALIFYIFGPDLTKEMAENEYDFIVGKNGVLPVWYKCLLRYTERCRLMICSNNVVCCVLRKHRLRLTVEPLKYHRRSCIQ